MKLISPLSFATFAVFIGTATLGNAEILPDKAQNLTQILRVAELETILDDEAVESERAQLPADAPISENNQWLKIVRSIYNRHSVEIKITELFTNGLTLDEYDELSGYFSGDVGTRALEMELEARRAMADPQVEEEARFIGKSVMAGDGPRVQSIQTYLEVHDIVDLNVSGTLNAQLRYLQGFRDAAAVDDLPDEQEMLSTLMSDIDTTRSDIVAWLHGFMVLAYTPLTDDELQGYVDASRTAAGLKLNRIWGVAFDETFDAISYDLGFARGKFMMSSNL